MYHSSWLEFKEPTEFCVKPNKALPIRQNLKQGKIWEEVFLLWKNIEVYAEMICEQPTIASLVNIAPKFNPPKNKITPLKKICCYAIIF